MSAPGLIDCPRGRSRLWKYRAYSVEMVMADWWLILDETSTLGFIQFSESWSLYQDIRWTRGGLQSYKTFFWVLRGEFTPWIEIQSFLLQACSWMSTGQLLSPTVQFYIHSKLSSVQRHTTDGWQPNVLGKQVLLCKITIRVTVAAVIKTNRGR